MHASVKAAQTGWLLKVALALSAVRLLHGDARLLLLPTALRAAQAAGI